MIELKSISKSFEGEILFSELNLLISEGKKIVITGRSGSGKTTLLNILGLIDSSDSGQVLYNNKLCTVDSSKIRNQDIGFVFQLHFLDLQMSVYENLRLPRLIQKKSFSRKEALDLLEKVDLQDKIDTKAKFLSGGQKQRVAFLRSLVNSPKIILADEPTGQLDPTQGKKLIELLLSLPQAVVLVTHDQVHASLFEERYELTKSGLTRW